MAEKKIHLSSPKEEEGRRERGGGREEGGLDGDDKFTHKLKKCGKTT